MTILRPALELKHPLMQKGSLRELALWLKALPCMQNSKVCVGSSQKSTQHRALKECKQYASLRVLSMLSATDPVQWTMSK